jgi:murein L,D-transpeptidase YcbB/YkuD
MPPSRCADGKLAPGASGPEVALLRKRLVISDDLPPELEAGDRYEAALVDAVKHFQLRHGLEANGSIDPQTLRALNEGEDDRRLSHRTPTRSLN